MITSKDFVSLLKKNGYDFFSGVPCSVFKSVIKCLQIDTTVDYIPTVREDISVSLSVGAYFGNRQPAILIQNSGLGNCLDTLIGLNKNYKIPLLLIISWRGYKRKDERQHWLWAEYQNDILKSIKIPKVIMSVKHPTKSLARANEIIKNKKSPVALIVIRGRLNENE